MDTIIEDFVIKSLKEESPFEDAFAENNDLQTFKEPLSPFRPLVLFKILKEGNIWNSIQLLMCYIQDKWKNIFLSGGSA